MPLNTSAELRNWHYRITITSDMLVLNNANFLKRRIIGSLQVLVSPCFRQNEIAPCKVVSFCAV